MLLLLGWAGSSATSTELTEQQHLVVPHEDPQRLGTTTLLFSRKDAQYPL